MSVDVTPRRDHQSVGQWEPWRDLRRRGHIDFRLDAALPRSTGGAVYVRDGDRAWIVIGKWLGQRERKCALAHELIHDERCSSCRSGIMPASWDAVVAREEAWIDREAARRLVPTVDLVSFVSRRRTVGSVTVDDIADHFDVIDRYAELAVVGLLRQPHGWGEIVA